MKFQTVLLFAAAASFALANSNEINEPEEIAPATTADEIAEAPIDTPAAADAPADVADIGSDKEDDNADAADVPATGDDAEAPEAPEAPETPEAGDDTTPAEAGDSTKPDAV